MVDRPLKTASQAVTIGSRQYDLLTLADRQQYHDPDGAHEAAGVSPAFWPLFGVTWDAGERLAAFVADLPIENRRILEIGAGLGLPSLVLHERGANVTPSDVHPLAAEFFAENLARNRLSPLAYRILDWRDPGNPGAFDVIIAADVLYEVANVEPLVRFVADHANDEFILADPGRGHVNAFTRQLSAKGFEADVSRDGKSRLVRYSRSTRSHQGVSETT